MTARMLNDARLRYGALCASIFASSGEMGPVGCTQYQMCFAPKSSGRKSRAKSGTVAPMDSPRRRTVTFHFAPALLFASTSVMQPMLRPSQ